MPLKDINIKVFFMGNPSTDLHTTKQKKRKNQSDSSKEPKICAAEKSNCRYNKQNIISLIKLNELRSVSNAKTNSFSKLYFMSNN